MQANVIGLALMGARTREGHGQTEDGGADLSEEILSEEAHGEDEEHLVHAVATERVGDLVGEDLRRDEREAIKKKEEGELPLRNRFDSP